MQEKSIIIFNVPYHGGMKTGRPLKSTQTDFAVRLAKLRVDAGLSQRQVAAALGISQPSYVLWEQHNVAITAEQLVKLATVLNVSVEKLFGQENGNRFKGGPTGKVRRIFEEVSKLPRNQQSKVVEFVEAFVRQKAASQ